MRSLFVLFLALFFSVLSVVAVSNPDISCPAITKRFLKRHYHVNARRFTLPPTTTTIASKRMTNAERLSRGLPLAPPVRRGTPTRRADPSAVPSYTVEGNIKVTDNQSGALLGYISKNTFQHEFHQYSGLGDALLVGINLPFGTTSGSGINIADISSDIGYPFVGVIDICDGGGAGNIGPGLRGYGYLVGTNLAAPYTGPQEVGNSVATQNLGSESAVWNVDIITGAMSIHWTNPGQTPVNVVTFHQPGDKLIRFIGDVSQYLGPGTVTPVKLTFVPVI